MSVYKPCRPSLFNPATGQGKKPPADPGEYRIRSAGREIAYIGETCDLRRRMGEHIRSGKLGAGATFCGQAMLPSRYAWGNCAETVTGASFCLSCGKELPRRK